MKVFSLSWLSFDSSRPPHLLFTLHYASEIIETPRHSPCIPLCRCVVDALSLACPAVANPSSAQDEASTLFQRRIGANLSASTAFSLASCTGLGLEYFFNKRVLAILRQESLPSMCTGLMEMGPAHIAELSVRSLLTIPAFVGARFLVETAHTLPLFAQELFFGALTNLFGARSEGDGSLSCQALLGQNASSWQLRDFNFSETVDPLLLRSWIQRNACVQGNRVVLTVCLQFDDDAHPTALSTRLEMSIEPIVPSAPMAAGTSR